MEHGVNALDFPPEVQNEMLVILAERSQEQATEELRKMARDALQG